MHAVMIKFLGVAITGEPLRSWLAPIGGNFSKLKTPFPFYIRLDYNLFWRKRMQPDKNDIPT